MAHIKDIDEKLAYCRRSADEAQRSAGTVSDPDMQTAYLAIQRTWIYLAEELEREMALAGSDNSMIHDDGDVLLPVSGNNPAYRSR